MNLYFLRAPHVLCVLCNKVLTNSSVLPAKLFKQQDTNHPKYKDNDIGFLLLQVCDALTNRQSLMAKNLKIENENSQRLLQTEFCNALAEMHTLAESLIKPCAVETAICVLG